MGRGEQDRRRVRRHRERPVPAEAGCRHRGEGHARHRHADQPDRRAQLRLARPVRGRRGHLERRWQHVEGGFVDYVKTYYDDRQRGQFAIPFEADTSPLFTRLDLLEKATGKREPPKTLDELTEVAKKINDPPGVYALGICLGRTPDGEGEAVQMIWNEGGSLVDKDGKPNLNAPATIDAMKRLKGWWDDKLIPPGSTTWDDTGNNSAYQPKQVAFVRNPPSIYAWMQTNDQELLKNSTMAAFPAGKGGSYSSSGAWSWSIFKASKNVDGAKDLIVNLMDPKKLQSVYEAVGGRWYPIYKNGPKHEYWMSREIYKFYPDLLAGGRGLWYPSSPEPKLMAALGEVRTRNVIPDMVQDIMVKGTAVETAGQDGPRCDGGDLQVARSERLIAPRHQAVRL